MSTRFRLALPRQIHDAIVAQAQTELPNECCGLLAGTIDMNAAIATVARHFPLVNVLASPVEFLSDARGMFDAVRAIDRQHWDILAVYHSHPSSPPRPSQKDRDRNLDENVMTMIISLVANEPEVQAWWLCRDNVQPADWHLV